MVYIPSLDYYTLLMKNLFKNFWYNKNGFNYLILSY